jgi:hypothetical protein
MLRFVRLTINGAMICVLLVLVHMACLSLTADGGVDRTAKGDPPFGGTIFIDPDIITSSDPTTLQGIAYAGQGLRTMYDRRVANWITVNAYLFNASFDDGLTAEVQVNPEFGSSDSALVEAQKNATVIGRLPTALRMDVQTVWIHKGIEPFGGGNNNLLIHIGQAALYEADGILEETFVHEASHSSLDASHASAPGWLAAQIADSGFISTYARDNPQREDIAESFLPYLAVRYRSDRITQGLNDTIVQTIPHRIAYFDSQSLNMYPIATTGVAIKNAGDAVPKQFALMQNYPNPFNPVTDIGFQIGDFGLVRLAVYDLLGREVVVLVNEKKAPGTYTVQFDARLRSANSGGQGNGLASGVYLYRMQTGSFVDVKKLVLLR